MTRAGEALVVAFLTLAACRGPASDPPPTPPPHCSSLAEAMTIDLDAVGEAATREIAAPRVHAYPIELETDESLEATVDQHGIDLTVALLNAEGAQLLAVDALSGAAGTEKLPWVAATAGSYHLLVCAPAAGKALGSYQLQLRKRQPAATDDHKSVAAATAFSRAQALRRRPGGEKLSAAIDSYRTALRLWRELDDRRQLDALYHLGQIHGGQLGQPDVALGYYQRAAAFFGPGDDPQIEAAMLHGIGRSHYELGEIDPARVAYQRALERRQAAGHRSGEAATANNLGLVLQQLGEIRAALTAFDRAAGRWQEIGDRSEEANTLHNRGRAYLDLGDQDQALADLERSLAIRRALGETGLQAWTLTAIGMVHEKSGHLEPALRNHQQALELNRQDGDRLGTAVSLNNMGVVYVLQNRPQEALRRFRQALPIFEDLADRRNQALLHYNIGWALSPTDADEALAYYRRALPLFEEFQDTSHHTTTRLGMATVERRRGHLESARELIEQALRDLEMLRTRTVSRHLRSSLFATKQDLYDFYIDLLMELHRLDPTAGHDATALTASERARARSQLDAMIDSGADPWLEMEPAVRENLRMLERDIHSRQSQRQRLLEEGAAEARLEAVEAKLRELLRRYDLTRAGIRASGSARVGPVDPPLLTADEIRRHIVDRETLFLEFNLGKDRSYLWAVTPDEIASFELPGRERIEGLARQAYRLLRSSRGRKWRAQSELITATLSDLLLGPVADRLAGQRLLIVAEGALAFLPFSALPAPRTSASELRSAPAELVGDRHEIVTIPSASTLAAIRRNLETREPPIGKLAILADPVFHRDDPRVIRQPPAATGETPPPSQRFPRVDVSKPDRLAYSRREAEAILELFAPGDDVLSAFDFAADRELVVGGALRDYRMLHFATHGEIDFDHPDLSRLVLSSVDEDGRQRDGLLFAHQIYELDLPADLVVLSACRTALGQEIRGEGLLGLTQSFFDAGAAAVVVSLWNVDDRATAELMAHFYRNLLDRGLPPAAALAAAQRAIRQQPRWRAPFYWAGFVFQGEWRPRGFATEGRNFIAD
ncbi:MAG: CHAT domain-containing tetratricopeptide repeat protein [Thermoanaerobaculia bacterium]